MWERIQKAIDRIESRLALWAWLVGSGVFGTVTGLIGYWTNWLNVYGPISWWFAGLLGALAFVWLMAGALVVRSKIVQHKLIARWGNKASHSVNPLDSEFYRKRLRLEDLAHPVTRVIRNKRFTECELMGPAAIVLVGRSHVDGCSFIDSDFVALKSNHIVPQNAYLLDSCTILSCSIAKAIFFVSPAQLHFFGATTGVFYLSLTGSEELDSQSRSGTEAEIPQ